MSFVLEGDSIAYGYGLSDPATQNFGALLSGKSWFSGKGSFYDFGVNGAGVMPGAGISIYDRYMANVYPHRLTANGGDGGSVAILLNEGGINDLAVLSRTAAQLAGDLLAYNTRAKADGFYVLADTLLPTTNLGIETRRLEVNAMIRAGQVGADFTFDSAQALPDSKDLSIYMADGTHPVAGGHARRATYMNDALVSGNGLIWDTHVAFCAGTSVATSATAEIANYDAPRLNRGNAFNLATGRFTAPRRGVLSFQFTGLQSAGGGQLKVDVRKNGQPMGISGYTGVAYGGEITSGITDVETGDVVSAWVVGGTLLPSNTQVGFMGHML